MHMEMILILLANPLFQKRRNYPFQRMLSMEPHLLKELLKNNNDLTTTLKKFLNYQTKDLTRINKILPKPLLVTYLVGWGKKETNRNIGRFLVNIHFSFSK
jgi:hypothetical protein